MSKQQRKTTKKVYESIKLFLKKKNKTGNMVSEDKNFPEHEQQRLVEYRKKLFKNPETGFLITFRLTLKVG